MHLQDEIQVESYTTMPVSCYSKPAHDEIANISIAKSAGNRFQTRELQEISGVSGSLCLTLLHSKFRTSYQEP